MSSSGMKRYAVKINGCQWYKLEAIVAKFSHAKKKNIKSKVIH